MKACEEKQQRLGDLAGVLDHLTEVRNVVLQLGVNIQPPLHLAPAMMNGGMVAAAKNIAMC